MTLYEFNTLSLEEKQTIIWVKDFFFNNYITKTEILNCYAFDKFFVEVVNDGVDNTITEERSFKHGHC